MKYQLKLSIALFCLLTAACGGQSGGFAPTATSPFENPIDVSAQSNFKFGESNTSSNGWEMSIDTTDPVNEVLLANGWNVEVRFE